MMVSFDQDMIRISDRESLEQLLPKGRDLGKVILSRGSLVYREPHSLEALRTRQFRVIPFSPDTHVTLVSTLKRVL